MICANISLTSFAPFPFFSQFLLGHLLLMLHVKQLPLGLGAKFAERPPCGVQLHQHKVCTDTFLERRSFWTAVTCHGILCCDQLQLDYKYKHWPLTCCYYQNLMLTTLESCCCSAYKVKILYRIWYYSCNSHIGWSCWCNLQYEIWGSLTGVTENSLLLGCDAVSPGVGSVIVPSPSGSTNPVYNITSKNNWISGLLCWFC